MRKTSGEINIGEIKIPAVIDEYGEETQANWAIYLFYFQWLSKEVHELRNDLHLISQKLDNLAVSTERGITPVQFPELMPRKSVDAV